MFSGLRKLSLFAIIASICNATFSALLCLYISGMEAQIGAGLTICLTAFLLTTSALFLGISIALQSCEKDIAIQGEHDAKVARDLKKRVEALERKLEQ